MQQKGEHTWNIVFEYHCCPKCGYIIESRENFQYRLDGMYQKDLKCPRCKNQFNLTKPRKSSFGPLIGEPQPPEMEWNE
jgi:rubredoxin